MKRALVSTLHSGGITTPLQQALVNAFPEDAEIPGTALFRAALVRPWGPMVWQGYLRKAYPGLMDFGSWLNRTGQARLLSQLKVGC